MSRQIRRAALTSLLVSAMIVTTLPPMALANSITHTKSIVGNPVSVGTNEFFVYQLDFACSVTTATDCGSVTIEDPFPAGVEYISTDTSSALGFAASYDAGLHTLTVSRPDNAPMAGGDSYRILVTVRVDSSFDPTSGSIDNRSEMTSTNSALDTTSNIASVPVVNTPQWVVRKTQVSPSGNPALDANVTYGVSICGPTAGNVPISGLEMVDILHPGATLVDADGGTYDGGAGTITWAVPDMTQADLAAVGSNQWCYTRRPQVSYDSASGFALGDTVGNDVEVVDGSGTLATAICNGDCVDSVSGTISDSIIDIAGGKSVPPTVSEDGFAKYTINYDARGSNVDVPGARMFDAMPPELQIRYLEIEPKVNPLPQAPGAEVWVSPDGGTNWALALDTGYNPGLKKLKYNPMKNAILTIPGNTSTIVNAVEIRYYDSAGNYVMPAGGMMRTVIYAQESPNNPFVPGTTVTNCAELTSDVGGPTECADVEITGPLASFGTTKDTPASTTPGTTHEVQLAMVVYPNNGLPIVDPVLADLLPPEFVFDSFVAKTDPTNATGAPEPSIEIIDDYLGSGRQLVRFFWSDTPPAGATQTDGMTPAVPNSWTFNWTIAEANALKKYGSQSVKVTFNAKPRPGTPVGFYENTATASTDTPSVDYCLGDAIKTGDGLGCEIPTTVEVLPAAALFGSKWDKGIPSLGLVNVSVDPPVAGVGCPAHPDDADFTRYPCAAQTLPSYTFPYTIDITNEGNVGLTDYWWYDILPHPGDVGVNEALVGSPRGSAWAALLTGPIALGPLPNGNTLRTIEYSDSYDPCRDQMANPGTPTPWPSGCVNDWTASPDNWADVKAVRIAIPFENEWLPGTGFTIDMPMVVPAAAPLDSIAWNSFAHVADEAATGTTMLPAAPRIVGIRIPGPGEFDPALLGWDSALTKSLNLAGSSDLYDGTAAGDKVTFDLTVTQQAKSIEQVSIVDYVDSALFDFVATDNLAGTTTASDGGSWSVGWDATDPTKPVVTLTGTAGARLDAGESITVPVVLTVDAAWSGAPLENWAEISNFDDDVALPGDAASGALSDPDSVPNTDPGDDNAPSGPGADGDDVISGDGDGTDPVTDDEDDHDVAGIPMWDLALIAELGAGQAFEIPATSTSIVWSITVANQGDQDAFDIKVADAIPNGLSFDSLTAATGVSTSAAAGDTGTIEFVINSLAVGETVTFEFTTSVDDASIGDYLNRAEISAFDHDSDPLNPVSPLAYDIDSNPNTDLGDDEVLTTLGTDPAGNDDRNSHNEVNFDFDGDGNLNEPTPGDEDDHGQEIVRVKRTYRIGNLVWLDLDDDGTAEDGEPGIGGVTVELWEAGATSASTSTTTDTDGNYSFSDLDAGDYYIVIPAGQTGLTINGESVDLADLDLGSTSASDPDSPSDVDNDNNGFASGTDVVSGTISVGNPDPYSPSEPTNETVRSDSATDDDSDTVPDAQSNYTVDVGFIPTLRVGNTVWLDNGGGFGTPGFTAAYEDNGTHDGNEPGIAGVLVQLLDDGGAVIAETVTDSVGNYWFDGLDAGTYSIGIPADQAPDLGAQPDIVVGAVDNLRSSTGVTTGPDATDDDDDGDPATGFLSLSAEFDLDHGTEATDETGDGAVGDAGAAEATANTAGSFIPDSSSNLSVDFGLVSLPTYHIGNLVWEDFDDDGVAEVGEPGIEGVLVQLLNSTGDVVAETVTDGDGRYLFDGLDAGGYQVRLPGDQTPTLGAQPTIVAGVLSDLSSSGAPTADPDSPSDVDNDNNGVVTGPDLTSGLLTVGEGDSHSEPEGETSRDDSAIADEAATYRDDRGNLSVDFGLHRGLRLGNQVYLDGTQGEATYNNGVFDAGEVGIAGVTVQLWVDDGSGTFDPALDTYLDSVVTDGEGNYWFEGLEPGVPYLVAVEEIPAAEPGEISSTGISASPVGADNDDDGDPGSGFASVSSIITLSTGGATLDEADTVPSENAETEANTASTYPDANSELTVDFGFVDIPLYRIGNLVWEDYDNDGVAEDGEPGIEGVLVQLLSDAGIVIGETVTDVDGHYVFENLAAGDYRVRVPSDQTPVGASPAGFDATVLDGLVSSTVDVVDADGDVDNDDNGVGDLPVTGSWTSGLVTLGDTLALPPSGDEPTNETLRSDDATDDDPDSGTESYPDSVSNLSVDFGFFGLSLGDRVWWDVDDDGVLDVGEVGVGGVVVELWDTSGGSPVLVDTVVTDGDGFYRFVGLLPGVEYVVTIPVSEFGVGEPLEGMFSSTDPVGGAVDAESGVDGDDNGIDNSGGPVSSRPVVLGVGDEPTGEVSEDGVRPDGSQNLTVDFGFHPGLRVGSLVWLDDGSGSLADENGIAEGVESGIGSVTLELWADGDGSGDLDVGLDDLVATTVTDGDGLYVFEHLDEGTYFVVIPDGEFGVGEPLEGLVSTRTGGLLDVNNNDDGEPVVGVGLVSGPVVLSFGGEPVDEGVVGTTGVVEEDGSWADANSNLGVDFGLIDQPTYRIGNLVWEDYDNDGVAEDGEPGIEGVLVQLLSDAGIVIGETVSDVDGHYVFESLAAGDYRVRVPSDQTALDHMHSSSVDQVDADGDLDNDDNGLGTSDWTSGVVTVGEGGIDGEPTNETVRSDDPTDDDDDFPTGEADGRSNYSIDFGFYRLSLGNQVFYDWNNSGALEGAESGIPGVVVNLLDADTGAPLQTTTTDLDGHYLFLGLEDETDYIVEISASNFGFGQVLDGYHSSTGPDVGGDPDVDQTDDDDNGTETPDGIRSAPITVDAGAAPTTESGHDNDPDTPDANENLTVDFGFYTLTLGNRIWLDTNDDGHIDPTENGISTVTVHLLDDIGTMIDTTVTDADGYYLFEGLTEGTYRVALDPVDFDPGGPLYGLESSTPTSDPASPADGDDDGSNTPVLESGPIVLTGGEAPPATDASNADPTIPLTNQDLTVDFGLHGMALGNLVFLDIDGDGMYDSGTEAGRADVTVELWAVDDSGIPIGTSPVATQLTDADGHYLFAGLEPGTYAVTIPETEFEPGGALFGYVSTIGNGVDAPDPDSDPSDDDDNGDPHSDGATWSDPVVLAPGTEPAGETDISAHRGHPDDANANLTVDLGFTPREGLTLGNRVWHDLDGDGIIDPGEPGIDGVRVELFDSDGSLVAFDDTLNDGYYLFPGLEEGEYRVVIPTSNFDDDTDSLWGYFPANDPEGMPTDPDDDIDNDDDGAYWTVPFGSVESGPVTLIDLFEPLGETDIASPGDHVPDDPNDNLTVDFGFVTVSLGGTVFADPDETGFQTTPVQPITGVEVHLLDEDGLAVLDGAGQTLTTTTDADGNYRFDGLEPGIYMVEIPAAAFDPDGPLDGWASTRGTDDVAAGVSPDPDDDVDGDDNGDPLDGDVFSGVAVRTQPVTLTPATEPLSEPDSTITSPDGNQNLTVDLGFFPVPRHELGGVVWIDADNDGLVDPSETVAPAGVVVNLLDQNGNPVLDSVGDPITTTTDADGTYLFVDLRPGSYIVEVDSLNVRDGGVLDGFWPSTGPNRSSDPNDDQTGVTDGYAEPDHTIRSIPIELYPESEPIEDPDASSTEDDYSNRTVDFGLYTINIDGLVWFDGNNDGRITADENPGAGVIVVLADVDGNPVVDSDGNPITTTTDADGMYRFEGVLEGEYRVILPAENFAEGGKLENFVGSKAEDNTGFIDDGSFLSVPFSVSAAAEAADPTAPVRSVELGLHAPTPESLAFTGATTWRIVGGGLALVLFGAAMLLTGTRGRRHHDRYAA